MLDVELNDIIGILDDVEHSGSFRLVLSDTIDVSEELLVDKNSPSDVIAVTDSVSRTLEIEAVLADTISVTDLNSFEANYIRSPSDTIEVTDSVIADRTKVYDQVLSDTIAVTDAQVLVEKSFPEDSISVTDILTTVSDYHRILLDTAVVTDTNSVETTSQRVLFDTIGVSDNLLVEPLLSRTVGDTISVGDSLSAVTSYVRPLSDVLDIGESLTVVTFKNISIALGETIAVTDTIAAEVIDVDVDVSDSISVSDTLSLIVNYNRLPSDTVSITETILAQKGGEVDRSASDTIGVTDSYAIKLFPGLLDDLITISDSCLVDLVGSFQVVFTSDGLEVTVPLPQQIPHSEVRLDKFSFETLNGGVPIQPVRVTGLTSTLQSGVSGTIVANSVGFSTIFETSGVGSTFSEVSGNFVTISDSTYIADSLTVSLLGANPSTYDSGFTTVDIGSYIEIQNGQTPGIYRVVSVLSPQRVVLDKPLYCLDSENGDLQWSLTSAVHSLRFALSTKASNNRYYQFKAVPLKATSGSTFDASGVFYSQGISKPRLESVVCDLEGVVSVTFDQPMRMDLDVVNLNDYVISGPTSIRLLKAWVESNNTIAIETLGFTSGLYTLTVNHSGTPKDEGSNTIDPEYNTTTFQAFVPERQRSIFTDKGPITKREEALQTGFGITVNSVNEVTVVGGSFNGTHVGKYLRLGSFGILPYGDVNSTGLDITSSGVIFVADSLKVELGDAVKYVSLDGEFEILGIVSATRVRIRAVLRYPEPFGVSTYWAIIDKKIGQIADNPLDVQVTVNGAVVIPETVRGLLGQIVLSDAPKEHDEVKVSYSWCPDPTVEVKGLNSPQFKLNSWGRNSGTTRTQHNYRYNNVLVKPGQYAPELSHALLRQPKLRELYYRGFERAYTPTLNDPSTLILNNPVHRISYPSAQRLLEEKFVNYEATTLPEGDIVPWVKKGAGAVSVVANTLVANDNVTGEYPYGQPLFWVQSVDFTYPHIYALSWRFNISSVTILDGVFTGICVGYSDERNAYVVGFLDVSGVKKIGFLKKGFQDPTDVASWGGGLDFTGNPTGLPVDIDWSQLRSYRILREVTGRVRLFVDGNILDSLRVVSTDVPTLQELNSPFDEIQGVFFGSLSRIASSTSRWDFVRHLSIPTNPVQVSPSVYVNYEGVELPETSLKPWTPVGTYGTETTDSSALFLDSTSATVIDPLPEMGLISGAYRGLFRLEPLLTSASQVVVDASVSIRSATHGVDLNAVSFAVNDGSKLLQVSFLADKPSPKISYGGGSLPEDFNPYTWEHLGDAQTDLVGKILRISDSLSDNGKVFFFEDTAPVSSETRVIASTLDYICEFRVRVSSYTADGSGFVGAFAQVFDGSRSLGLLLAEIAGIKKVVFHTDGVFLGSFTFDWEENYHTYRFVKNTGGNLVTLFVDGVYVGSQSYSSFTASAGTAFVSFGSSTPSSSTSLSVVDWEYCNVWRVVSTRKYVGLWKGYDPHSLTGYHLPTKASGTATVIGNTLQDLMADFNTVSPGDLLVVDYGSNKGVYEVASLISPVSLTITTPWELSPTEVSYRILSENDWTFGYKYRLFRDPTGQVMLFKDSESNPLIQVSYNSINFPDSSSTVLDEISGGLPAISFGAFSSDNLSQSVWDYVRYGISKNLNELKIVPHHQVLNQWNVMQSPERLYTIIPHDLTSFKSSSTGITTNNSYKGLLEDPTFKAYTTLNEDTPLMPKTQTFSVRKPYPTQEFIAGINNINNVLNSVGAFTLNNKGTKYRLVVPDNVLYSSLEITEKTSGEKRLLTPAMDTFSMKGLSYQKEICLKYDGTVLPENDTTAATPWILESDVPSQVFTTALDGVLTYRTLEAKTVYKNNTPLPDAIGLVTEVKFRIRVKDDSTGGLGDTRVRFGVSSPGMTLALAFVTTPKLERLVLILDLKSNKGMGAFSHDFLDGNFYTYKIIQDAKADTIKVSIEP